MSVTLRIRKLMPILGSSHVGEVVATRDAIIRTLRAVGLDLNDLADAISFPDRNTANVDRLPSFGDLARACRDLDHGRLNERERDFVLQMCRFGFTRSPSQRQLDWLAAIFARLKGRAAA